MSRPTLFLGNKNYSSWSLRPWLALRWAGVAFDEVVIPLGGPGYGKSRIPEILDVSPSGRVPALRLGETTIWDSLAISEWAAEKAPFLYPGDATLRAVCRSIVAEVHSSFAGLRRDLSMNIRRRTEPRPWADDVQADLARVTEIWTGLRTQHTASGPFLFGRKSVADAFFTPIATRFRTYGVSLPTVAGGYLETLLSDPDFRVWEEAALAEPYTIPSTDDLYP